MGMKILELGRLMQMEAAKIVDDENRYPMIGFINKKDAEVMRIGTAAEDFIALSRHILQQDNARPTSCSVTCA